MADRRRALLAACRRPFMARLLAAFGAYSTSEIGSWVAITAVAHDLGGVNEVSVVLMAVLAPSMLLAAAAGTLGERWGTRRVLVGGLVVQGTGFVAASLLLVVGAPAAAVYAGLVVASLAMVTTRPMVIPLLPVVAPEPSTLTAANVLLGWTEGAGLLVGPLVTGAVLATVGSTWVFVPFAALSLLGAALLGIGRFPGAERSGFEDPSPGTGLVALWEVVRSPGPRAAVVVLGVQAFCAGVVDLLFIVVAVDILGDRPAGAGWLSAAFGVGALVGGLGASALVGARRIWPFSAVAATVLVVAVGLTGGTPSLWVGLVVFGVAGVAATWTVVSTRTILQRIASLHLLAHTFSLVETATMAMLFAGAAVFPVLVAIGSVQTAPAMAAGVALVALVLSVPRLAAAESVVPEPTARIELLTGVVALSLLPPDSASALATAATELDVAAGDTLFRAGEAGDAYYVVASGRMDIIADGRRVASAGPGTGFGEYALVRDAPRSATVTAVEDSRLLRITREDFLLAVLGHSPTLQRVRAVAEGVHRTAGGDADR